MLREFCPIFILLIILSDRLSIYKWDYNGKKANHMSKSVGYIVSL